MITYGQVISRLAPTCEFRCDGDATIFENYSSVNNVSLPTKSECDAEIVVMSSELAHKLVEDARRYDFQIEADPLFFGWQRGENIEQDWLDKVAEIRARHPYPA